MKPKNHPQRLLLVCRRLEEFYPARIPVSPCQKEQVKLTLPLSQLAQDLGVFFLACFDLVGGSWKPGAAACTLGGTFLAATTIFCNLLPAAMEVLEAGNTGGISLQSCRVVLVGGIKLQTVK